MSYKVIPTPQFEKEVKKLSKKYPSAKGDIVNLVNELKENPTMGIPLANSCFKIRLAIKSKGKGKSGGSRVIPYVRVMKEVIHLLTIYDKSTQSTISDTEIIRLLEGLQPNIARSLGSKHAVWLFRSKYASHFGQKVSDRRISNAF